MRNGPFTELAAGVRPFRGSHFLNNNSSTSVTCDDFPGLDASGWNFQENIPSRTEDRPEPIATTNPTKHPTASTTMNPMNLTSLVRNSVRAITASLLITATSFAGSTPFSKIIVFGDSLSDTGNASILTYGNFPPPQYYADGRMSNGSVWVDYLAESLGMELQPEHQYAVVGACSGVDNFSAIAYNIPQLAGTGLQWQIATFLTDSGPGGVDPNALYIVWIGANDIFLNASGDINLTVYQAIQNTAGAVATLASQGARHILVANLPDLGLTPLGLDQGPQGSAQLSGLTDGYNYYLDVALDSLEAAGIRTIRLDAAGLIREIAADPAPFGLTNVTDRALYSASDADGFLFWDDVHPTTTGHQVMAERAVKELIAFYSPRRGHGKGHGLVKSLKGLVKASGR